MGIQSKMTAIANAIREKSGKSGTLTLDGMAKEISGLNPGERIAHADIPDYVKAEALSVARKVEAVRQKDSIVFLAMSDSHFYGQQGTSGVDSYVDSSGTQGNVSNLHGAMGAKVLAYALPVDFIAHLGDLTWGHKTTTSNLLHSQVSELSGYLNEAFGDLPKFFCVGNHDSGIYYHNAQIEAGKTGTFTESAEWIYNNFTKYSESDDTVIAGEDCGGYCYRDFTDKKLRVFMLNTSQALIEDSDDACTYGSQRIWLGKGLLDLNSKSDASQWSFLVLSHYPADYGGTMPLSELLKAYVEGGSISVTNEKTNTATTLNFSGKNAAKMIAQFHGHVHNFKSSKLHSYATGSAKQYEAWRMCIPNGQYNRENYYSTVGSMTDIDFSEETSYSKTPNTGRDTSFVINVINPSEQVIHSICYGAGYDRVVGYGATVYWGITTVLTGSAIDNDATSVEDGMSYTATISANEGYTLSGVQVLMGGVDVTSSVYADGRIQIDSVTGDVKITAVAAKPVNYTNMVPLSTDANGNIYNNGLGYKDGYAMSSSNTEVEYGGFTITGFIPVQKGCTIRLAGSAFADHTEYSWRFVAYDANYNYLHTRDGQAWANAGTIVQEDTTSVTWIPNEYTITDSVKYCRISCRTGANTASVNGKDLIITIDEPID